MKRISNKRAIELHEYKRLSKEYMEFNCFCAICPKPSKVLHHIRGNKGKMLLLQQYWVPLCRKCYNRIKNDPKWAQEAGYLAKPGEWLKP